MLRNVLQTIFYLSAVVQGITSLRLNVKCRRSLFMSLSSTNAPPAKDILSAAEREKSDPTPDAYFYSAPRFVFHVDSDFTKQLTELYREKIEAGAVVLDMMSSWVSHFPTDIQYSWVDGLGLNREELQRNPQLTNFRVHDLNADPFLPYDSNKYDVVTCTVSIQYLQQPERIFADMYRVMKPGGCAIISFSNRMFGTKAISAWTNRNEEDRIKLVASYFNSIDTSADNEGMKGFTEPEIIVKKRPLNPWILWIARDIIGLNLGGDPFFAVCAYKDFKP